MDHCWPAACPHSVGAGCGNVIGKFVKWDQIHTLNIRRTLMSKFEFIMNTPFVFENMQENNVLGEIALLARRCTHLCLPNMYIFVGKVITKLCRDRPRGCAENRKQIGTCSAPKAFHVGNPQKVGVQGHDR